MAYEINSATNHYNLLAKIRTFAESTLPVAERYTVLRAVTTGSDHEVIWKAPGLSGTEEIFFGIKTYQSGSSDYYNFKLGAFTGYVSGNPFEGQPGSSTIVGVPLWDSTIPYWLQGDGSFLSFFAKVENVYTSGILGKYLPYNTQYQYPYPLLCGGCLPTASATRYSDISYNAWFVDKSSLFLRNLDGVWINPDIWPQQGTRTIRNTNNDSSIQTGYYTPHKIILSRNAPDLYGELRNIFYISGFNNAVENTFTIGTDNYVVMRNVGKLGFKDYVALRLI